MSASYATVADVIALAKELAGVDSDQLELIVDVISHEMIDAGAWGSKLFEAHRLLAAHVATIELNPSGATGLVASRTIGQISESYQASTPTDAEFGATKYGRYYLLLRRTLKRSTSWAEPDRGWETSDGSVP